MTKQERAAEKRIRRAERVGATNYAKRNVTLVGRFERARAGGHHKEAWRLAAELKARRVAREAAAKAGVA